MGNYVSRFTRHGSEQHVFRPHFQTFILIFPDDGGIKFQQLGRELAADAGKQCLGFLGGLFVGVIIVAGCLALAVVPVGNGVDGRVEFGPLFQITADGVGNFIERNQRVAAMLADQTGVADIAREQRQHGRAAAGRLRVTGGRRGEALEPDLAVVRELRGDAIRAEQGMGEPPGFAFDLAEGLREPARQGHVVEVTEDQAVFLPEQVERRFRVGCHRG